MNCAHVMTQIVQTIEPSLTVSTFVILQVRVNLVMFLQCFSGLKCTLAVTALEIAGLSVLVDEMFFQGGLGVEGSTTFFTDVVTVREMTSNVDLQVAALSTCEWAMWAGVWLGSSMVAQVANQVLPPAG